MQVGIVGLGRLGRHLAYWWSCHQVPFWITSARNFSIAQFKQNLFYTPAIFLAVKDDHIRDWVRLLRELTYEGVIFHFSGALTIPETIDLHPLASFGHTFWSLPTYEQIPWISTHKGAQEKICRLIPQLRWSIVENPQLPKPLYHAWATLLAAGIPALSQAAIQAFSDWGVSADQVKHFLYTIWLTGIREGQPSGPWIRQDQGTIQAHEQALAKHPEWIHLYQTLKRLAEKTTAH